MAEPAPPIRSARAELLRAALLAFALLVLTFAFHAPALDGWWGTDDPQVLLQAVRNTPAETLFDPDDWRTLSTSSFTPLVTISFDADHALFGVRPFFFYQHQLLAIGIAVLLLYVLLEPVAGRGPAWLVAAAVAVSPPVTLAAGSLMIRHYVEGLALALGALLAWRMGEPDRARPGREIGVAVLYLLAMLAKEIYAPLPLLFLADAILRKAGLRTTVLRLLPSAAAAAAYLAWRGAMLGAAGGYGADLGFGPGTLWHLWQSLYAPAPGPLPVVVPLALLALFATALARRPRAALLLGAATGAAVLLPLVPLGGLIEARYAFLPVTAATVLAGVAAAGAPRRVAVAVLLLLALLQGAASIALRQSVDRAMEPVVTEGKYVWHRSASAPPLVAQAPGWYLEGLRDLRRSAGEGESPQWVLSMQALAAGAVPPERVVRAAGEGAVSPLDRDTIAHMRDEAARRDDGAPLTVRVALRNNELAWELGPGSGGFIWLTLPGWDEYVVAATGGRRIPAPQEPVRFRIRRDLPDGRWTISPELAIPPSGGEVSWSRGM